MQLQKYKRLQWLMSPGESQWALVVPNQEPRRLGVGNQPQPSLAETVSCHLGVLSACRGVFPKLRPVPGWLESAHGQFLTNLYTQSCIHLASIDTSQSSPGEAAKARPRLQSPPCQAASLDPVLLPSLCS